MIHYSINCLPAHVVKFCKKLFHSSFSITSLSYLFNLIPSKLGSMMILSKSRSWSFKPSFKGAISHIVRSGANEQMIGINAISDIARMANKHTIGDLSFMNLIRNSMSPKMAPIRSSFIKNSISINLNGGPKPTSVCFSNFFEKSFFLSGFFEVAFK